MRWSHREIRDDLAGQLGCSVCGKSTNGRLMLREWDSGETELYCRKHSRSKEWIEFNREEARFKEMILDQREEEKRELDALLDKVRNADGVSWWWSDDCLVIEMPDEGEVE